MERAKNGQSVHSHSVPFRSVPFPFARRFFARGVWLVSLWSTVNIQEGRWLYTSTRKPKRSAKANQ